MGPFSSGFRTQHNMAVKMTPTIIDHPRQRHDRVRSPSWTAMPQHSQENFAANEGCTGSLAMTGSSPAYYQAYYDYEEVDEQNDRQVMDSFDDALAATGPLERFQRVPEHPFEDMVCTSSHTFGSLMEDSVDAFRGTAEPQMRDFPEERCSSSAHPLSSLQPGSARACSAFLDDEHLMEEPY